MVPAMSWARTAGLAFESLPSRERWASRAERAAAWARMEVVPVKPCGPVDVDVDVGVVGCRCWDWP